MLGGLGLARWSLIWLPALCAAGGLLVLLGLGRALNALMAGEQTAVTLGLTPVAYACGSSSAARC